MRKAIIRSTRRHANSRVASPLLWLFALGFAGTTSLAALPIATPVMGQSVSQPQSSPAPSGQPFSAQKLSSILPDAVYFQGKSASLQLRNAAGTSLGGAIVWASLVDSSGYSSGVQEKYQFYFVTESSLRFGEFQLPAGAYGGGFVGGRFVIMDLGGHTVAEGPTQHDADLRRPRPLEMLPDSPTSVKLYLGRNWVLLRSVKAACELRCGA